jgi:spoIIIJ-associated protein
MVKKEESPEKVLGKIVKKLLVLMGSNAQADIELDKKENALMVEIKTEDEAGLLIGSRGETLSALQMLLGMMLKQKIGEWHRVLVNIADWREKEELRLIDLAQQTAERARDTGEAQTLYNLSPSQRRMVHLELSKIDDVETESFGEGSERYLSVRVKG